MIEGVQIKDLKPIIDDRGFLTELVRESDFKKKIILAGKTTDLMQKIPIKQTYLTTIREKGIVKGMHYHKLQYDRFIAISGAIKLVLVDTRIDSDTFGEIQIIILEDRNKVVLIPPKVLHGFQALTDGVMILNNVSEEYNHKEPDEYRFPYFGEYYIDKNTGELCGGSTYKEYLIVNKKIHQVDLIKLDKDVWRITNR